MDPVLHKTFFDAVGKGLDKELDNFVSTCEMEVAVQCAAC